MPDWPRVLLTTVTFDQDGARTRMRLTWTPHEASDAELACFTAAIDGMGKGCSTGMELLAKVLAELIGPRRATKAGHTKALLKAPTRLRGSTFRRSQSRRLGCVNPRTLADRLRERCSGNSRAALLEQLTQD
jgi:hypothetical protein